MDSESVTSRDNATAFPPSPFISSTTASALLDRAEATTTKPVSANYKPIARPIPREAPVTHATRLLLCSITNTHSE